MIKGWDEGVPQLSLGQKANLICTPDYGGSRSTRFSTSLCATVKCPNHPPTEIMVATKAAQLWMWISR